MDEVQLMDVGLATSAQLQAYRDAASERGFRPCYTWWMSATLQPNWLSSVDTKSAFEEWRREPCQIPPDARKGGIWEVGKALSIANVGLKDAKEFAELVLINHDEQIAGEYGKITLVVCNTVQRAVETHAALKKQGRKEGLELVHSRFRPHEREAWSDFLKRSACDADADRIIVATQVVEAGVDISAGCLVTELAPWPSLVQRFGRCARYGGSGKVIVVDRGQHEKSAPPYEPRTLTATARALKRLEDVGLRSLEEFEGSLSDEEKLTLYPYEPSHLLMEDEFTELFDTTPDLTGADLDISRFIRSGEERDLQVFWLKVGKHDVPDPKRQPLRSELCSVPFLAAQDWLREKKKSKLRDKKRAWIWDWIDGEWVIAKREMLLPGRIVCVASNSGGYSATTGFDPGSSSTVTPVPLDDPQQYLDADDENDLKQEGEPLSHSEWKTIAFHSQEVADEVAKIIADLQLPAEICELLQIACRWHDLGKAHPAFQGMLRDTPTEQRPDRSDLAKGPEAAWPKHKNLLYMFPDDSEQRRGFRHELASALALFSVLKTYAPEHPALLGPWVDVLTSLSQPVPEATEPTSHPEIQRLLKCSAEEFDLLVYLMASHHGKVRVALHASPADQDYRPPTQNDIHGLPIRGVRSGDELPSIAITPDGKPLPPISLTLEPATLGLSYETGASWRERTQAIIARYGPGGLAFLEAILRSADIRASQSQQPDPVFTKETV